MSEREKIPDDVTNNFCVFLAVRANRNSKTRFAEIFLVSQLNKSLDLKSLSNLFFFSPYTSTARDSRNGILMYLHAFRMEWNLIAISNLQHTRKGVFSVS